MQTEFRQYGLEDRVQLVPLPLDGGSSHPTALASKQPGGRILYVGRLVDVKGISYLIRAVAEAQSRLPRPLALTIAGEGPDRQELADLARRLSVNAVFTGWIDGPDKTELFQQSDLLAVPSLWPEPFGLTGIEAGVFGVPAVGFAVGGIPDWLITGQSGELAPGDPPSVGGLSDAIVRALADPEHYRRLCEGARSVASRHTMNNHLNRLESIFASAGQGQFSSIAAPAETPTRATLG
jgi:glycosyltransferase involved in cell wall biosynthesis